MKPFARLRRAIALADSIRAWPQRARPFFVAALKDILDRIDASPVHDDAHVDLLLKRLRRDLLGRVDELETQLAEVQRIVGTWNGGSATALIRKIENVVGREAA